MQYDIFELATVIGSAVVPTLIGNAFFLPHHLLPQEDGKPSPQVAEVPEYPSTDSVDAGLGLRTPRGQNTCALDRDARERSAALSR